ncbi:galactokinase [Acidobacteriota bacterium]
MLNNPIIKESFTLVYGSDERIIREQVDRYQNLLNEFKKKFAGIDDSDIRLFSTPGRTEISGNHTDHNHGRVIAAAVNLDAIAAVVKIPTDNIIVYSKGYEQGFEVNLNELNPLIEEQGATNALIRGIAARFRELGYQIGGFHAYIFCDVLPGSGLSSSAVIEVLIADILNTLYNERQISEETLAIIGQYAENHYFNKPCGLMDQLTCVKGGIVTIDFKNPQEPMVKKVSFDFDLEDFSILVVNTGGSHADLTDDYAAIPREMRSVAEVLGKKVCREIDYKDVMRNPGKLRTSVGDRAILRALHFISENRRVKLQVDALQNNDFELFLSYVRESGNSSLRWLQNCSTAKDTADQGITLALALTEKYIEETGRGACRVHGGGFAGTIQVFLPNQALRDYIRMIEPVFGKDCVSVLTIRPEGTRHLNPK